MEFKEKAGRLLKKYKHVWVLLYVPVYLLCFFILEHRVTDEYRVIHSALDDKIPFIEYFIVPYLLWFLFMAIIVLYFFFTDVEEFYRLVRFLFVGMTIFLIISSLIPNGLNLRPTVFERDNIFVDAVRMLYQADTPTNVFPSIHVYNSIVIGVSVHKSKRFSDKKGIRCGVYVMAALIILSTMFLKQHSVIDVAGAAAMAYVLYPITYAYAGRKASSRRHVARRRMERKSL